MKHIELIALCALQGIAVFAGVWIGLSFYASIAMQEITYGPPSISWGAIYLAAFIVTAGMHIWLYFVVLDEKDERPRVDGEPLP